MRRSIRRGSVIDLPEGSCEVSGVSGSAVRLRRERDGLELLMDLADLPGVLGEPLHMADPRFDPALSNTLSSAERRLVNFRLRAVLRVIGRADPDDVNFSLYDPATTTEPERLRTQAAELKAREQPGCENTLRNWVRKYKSGGVLALRERRACRIKEPFGWTDPRILEVIEEVLAEYSDKSDTTDKLLVRAIRKKVSAKYSGTKNPPPIPHDRTLRRRLKTKRDELKANGNARRRRSMSKVPDHMFNRRPVLFPGEEVQADTSPFDVVYLDKNARISRSRVTLMLDIGTRSIIGEVLTDGPPTGLQHSFMIVASMTTPAVASGPALPWTVNLSSFDWAEGLTPIDVRAAVEARPFISTFRLILDNARDNRSNVVLATADQLGIDLTFGNPGDPTSRPEGERIFESLWTLLAEDLPGYVSRGPDFRADNFDKDSLLDIYTLAAVLQAWIAIRWQNREHEGLRDHIHTGVRLTPNQMFEAMFDRTGELAVPLAREEYISHLPSKRLTCQADGFQIDYRRYDSEALHPFRRQPCPYTDDGKWPVHYNASNPTAVWVKDPHVPNAFIQCDWMNRQVFKQPFNRDVRRAGREAAKRIGVDKQPELVAEFTYVLSQTDAAHDHMERANSRAQTNQTLAKQMGLTIPEPLEATSFELPSINSDSLAYITAFAPEEESW